MTAPILLLGAGRMGGALIQGWSLTGAFAVSVMTTAWDNGSSYNRAELAGLIHPENAPTASMGVLDNLVQQQAVMLSTNWTFLVVTMLFAVAAAFIWLAPKRKKRT